MSEKKEKDFMELIHEDDRNELIGEFLKDLKELSNNEHWEVPPLSNLIGKWENKL